MPSVSLIFTCPTHLLNGPMCKHFNSRFPVHFSFLSAVKKKGLDLRMRPLARCVRRGFNVRCARSRDCCVLSATRSTAICLNIGRNVSPRRVVGTLGRTRRDKRFSTRGCINGCPIGGRSRLLVPTNAVRYSKAGKVMLRVDTAPCVFAFGL